MRLLCLRLLSFKAGYMICFTILKRNNSHYPHHDNTQTEQKIEIARHCNLMDYSHPVINIAFMKHVRSLLMPFYSDRCLFSNFFLAPCM